MAIKLRKNSFLTHLLRGTTPVILLCRVALTIYQYHHPHFAVRNYPLGLLGGIPGLGLGFGGSKRKKSWTRAVFSNLQRKGLEKR